MAFSDLIKVRQSVRSFKAEVPSRELLEKLVDAALLAPSAVNFQPWQMLVVTDITMLTKVKDCYHRDWINEAPVCIVVLGNHQESWHRQADNKDHCDIDVAIAIDHLTLQAAELGLGTCWVCNFEVEKVRDLFQLPTYMEPIALLPLGYPSDDKALSIKEKKRKTRGEIVKWI